MSNEYKVTDNNHLPSTGDGRFLVYSKQFNELANRVVNPGYKIYRALLTQSGTSAPTAIVLENTLGVIPTF